MQTAKTHRQSMLRVLPKSQQQALPRHLNVFQGIMWSTVAPVFERFGWQIEIHTDHFIRVHHRATNLIMVVSNIGQGRVLINQNYQTYVISELHELEAIADFDTLI